MAIKIIHLAFFVIFGTICLSQKLHIALQPSSGTFFGTYQNKVLERNNTTNLLEYREGSLGNIGGVGISYGLDVSVFELKKFIFGLSVFNSGATYGHGAMYYTTANLVEAPPNAAKNKVAAFYTVSSNNIFNAGVYLSYKLSTALEMKVRILYQKDRTSIGEEWADALFMEDGIFYYIETTDTQFEKKNSAGLGVALEKTFYTKKNKQLFSVNLAYLQGMRIMGRSTAVFRQIPLNYQMITEAVSRASGFNLTISRTFKLYNK